MQITHKGKELDIEINSTPNGLRVWVWVWNEETNNLDLFSNYLYPLTTPFEALCHIASDLYGEAVEGESLAHLLGIDMITSDDAACEKCGRFYHYEEMVHGSEMLDDVAEALNATNWDYFCEDCYLEAQERLERESVGA